MSNFSSGLARSQPLVNLLSFAFRRRPRTSCCQAFSARHYSTRKRHGGNELKDFLAEVHHDVWGYVIYRTTYEDESTWQTLKSLFIHEVTNMAEGTEMSKIVKMLKLTFIEDRARFDGASRHFLREHFNNWAADAVVAENPRAIGCGRQLVSNPRYSKFIQIDTKSLESTSGEESSDMSTYSFALGHVNIVDAQWIPPDPRPLKAQVQTAEETLDEYGIYEEIDGCVEQWVGWMKIHPSALSVEHYLIVGTDWDGLYVRPPAILKY